MLNSIYVRLQNVLDSHIPDRYSVFAVYGVSVFVVYGWSVMVSFWQLPSWIFSLNLSQIFSVYAYTFAFDFLESAMLWFSLLTFAVILPRSWWCIGFAAKGTLAIIILIASIALNTHYYWVEGGPKVFVSIQMIWWVITLLFTLIATWAVHRVTWLRAGLEDFADRCLVFVYIYLPLTAISLCLVIGRNIL